MRPQTLLAAGAAAALRGAGIAAAAAPAPAEGPLPFKAASGEGLWHYRYETSQTIPGQPEQGYRTDFDIRVGKDGGVDAIILSSAERSGTAWTPVSLSPDCAAKLKAPQGALATARLWPLPPEAAHGLGADFLDACAPGPIFFPLTDILNVVLVQRASPFGLETLKTAGQSASYPGFEAHFERNGQTFAEVSHGGVTTLVSLSGTEAVVDWVPAPADLHMVMHNRGGDVTMDGTETFAFRLVIDPRTGVLIRADSLRDDLDLKATMPGMAGAFPVKITRKVSIVRL